MPFSTTGSVISTDLDNMIRGLYRDNSDHALTGTTGATDLASFSIPGNTIGPTGALHIIASGQISGGAGTKTIKFFWAGVAMATISDAAGTTLEWFFDIWIFNTATNAQRMNIQRSTNDAATSTFSIATPANDTTVNIIVKINAQLGSAADTITQKTFDIFVVQIT